MTEKLGRRFYERAAAFFIFSFLGWGMETVICLWPDGKIVDRGFLSLPLCTIYGFTVLAIDRLIGTPRQGGLLLRKVRAGVGRSCLYYLMAVLIPTAAELATGLFFDTVFGIRLWDYSWHRFHFLGYISLGISLSWGILVMAVMGVFPVVMRLIGNVPERILKTGTLLLFVAAGADYLECLGRAIKAVR